MNVKPSRCVWNCPKARLTLILALLVTSWVAHAGAQSPPNVLLITADDLGLQLGCYGDQTVPTPNLDALAARGVQFRTAYVAQASCSPSRSTMFTGLYPHGNGHYGLANANVGFRQHAEIADQVLPNVLRRAGYRTGLIGKLHVQPESAFEFDFRTGEGFGSRDVRGQVESARSFWREAEGQPWFLMFNLFDPHVGRERRPDGSRGPQYFPDVVQGLPTDPVGPEDIEPWPWQQIGTDEQLEKIAGYYNCVQRIDAAIGLLTEALRETGAEESTVIIFLGDHGPPFARGKTSCYEAGLRVPFLVVWPGVTEPHVSDRLVSSADIYPTVLDAVGLELPDRLHGASLRPILSAAAPGDGWRETLVGEFHYHGAAPFFPRRAITDGRFKLIHNLRAGDLKASPSIDGDSAPRVAASLPKDDPVRQAFERLEDPPEWELYNLRRDPIEFENLVGQAAHAEVERRLRGALERWQKRTADPFVDPAFRRHVEAKYVH